MGIPSVELDRAKRENDRLRSELSAMKRALRVEGWPQQTVIDRCLLLAEHYANTRDKQQPDPSEVNPSHKVTSTMRGQWHKLMALVMHKLVVKQVVIDIRDFESFPGDHTIVAYDSAQGLQISLCSMAEAKALAKRVGQSLTDADD